MNPWWDVGKTRLVAHRIADKVAIDAEYFKTLRAHHQVQTRQKARVLRNLRNAWFNECALRDPPDVAPEERMRFPTWKITQFYYTLFLLCSSVVRTKRCEELFQRRMLNVFLDAFLASSRLKGLFLEPFNIYVRRGHVFNLSRSTLSNSSERKIIRESLLKEARSGNRSASALHCLLSLREWVSYEQSSIFERMYSIFI